MPTLFKTIWQGHYFDGRTAARHEVTISVTSDGLHIEKGNDTKLWWPYEELRQTQGFHPGEPVRLERGREIAEVLVVEEGEFLQAIHQVDPRAQNRFRISAGRPVWIKFALLAVTGVVFVAWGLYVWGIPALADAVAARVPVSWEERLGQSTLESLAPVKSRCREPERLKVLEGIVAKLVDTAPDAPYTFQLTVVRGEMVNAFAAPGGFIVVYEGLLRKTRTPEELAGVLAHEIQHCLERHSTRAILRRMSTQALIVVLTGGDEGMRALLELAGTFGELSYSRSDEEAADRAGLKMVQAAGIDPKGMAGFLSQLEEGESDLPESLRYLSTHPRTAERIEQINRLAADAPTTPVPLLPGYPWSEMGNICEENAMP